MKYKIKEVCEKITSGGTPSRTNTDYYKNGKICWLKTQELLNNNIYDTKEHISYEALNNSSAKILPINTVVLAMYGATAGNLGILKTPAATNQACANMITKSDMVNYQYLFYCLLNHKTQLLNLAIGAAQQNLSLETISNFEIDVPRIDIQQHIVNILGTIDDKIENNEKIIIKLNKLMLTVFKDFQNKLLGHEPIPLGEFISFIKGKKPNEMKTHLLPYLSIDSMSTNNYESVCSDGMILANTNDILMVMDGASSGAVYSGYFGIVGSTLAKLYCKKEEISLLIEQKLIQMQNKIKELNTGSAIPHANKEFIQSITIKLSNDELQTRIINQLRFIKQKILACRSLNIKLIQLKNLYLKKFFR